MPRKQVQQQKERPPYLSADGELNLDQIFQFQPKQLEMLHIVTRKGGKQFLEARAPQCLSTGGIRSGKTVGVMMFMVMHYCLKFKGCDILILRRTFKELESGAIADFKAFMPEELYTYDQTKHVATLYNGSRVVFGHCQNNKDRDIEQYLGQAYPAILVDECGQFSPDAWQMLFSRNTVNANCQPDEYDNMPNPVIWGCTNPLGPHYEYYRTLFVLKEPWQKPDGARRDDKDGTWWVQEGGEWSLIYDPQDYIYQRTTVLDNPAMLKRDPLILQRLRSMPKAKRDKMLLGLDGRFEGQYFDCFDPSYHVVSLRDDPEAIIWQPHQPVWAGQDWGMGHANTIYFFTKALVKRSVGDDYVLKTVCFREVVVTGGKTNKEIVSILKRKLTLPTSPEPTPFELKAIYFSHEKFARSGTEAHTPADDYSRELRKEGMPPVTSATKDRIGSASFIYNKLKNGELVILDTCREIISTFPILMRDPDNMDDVLKTETRGDDCYDGFRYGLYGELRPKKKPTIDDINEKAKKLDPIAAHFYRIKMMRQIEDARKAFVPKRQPYWVGKANGPYQEQRP